MEGLAIGRMVHYVTINEDGETSSEQHEAAIVSGIWDGHTGVVRLHVMTRDGISVIQQVGYSAEPVGNSWHWIERA